MSEVLPRVESKLGIFVVEGDVASHAFWGQLLNGDGSRVSNYYFLGQAVVTKSLERFGDLTDIVFTRSLRLKAVYGGDAMKRRPDDPFLADINDLFEDQHTSINRPVESPNSWTLWPLASAGSPVSGVFTSIYEDIVNIIPALEDHPRVEERIQASALSLAIEPPRC